MITMLPVTASNAPLWMILMAAVGVAVWHLIPLLFPPKDKISCTVWPPKRWSEELECESHDCACPSLYHPADMHKQKKSSVKAKQATKSPVKKSSTMRKKRAN